MDLWGAAKKTLWLKEELNKLEFRGWWWGIPRLKGKKNEVVQMLRGASWYKMHLRESVKKVLEILGGDTLLGWRLKVWGGFLASLRALHLEREEEILREHFREENKGFKREGLWASVLERKNCLLPRHLHDKKESFLGGGWEAGLIMLGKRFKVLGGFFRKKITHRGWSSLHFLEWRSEFWSGGCS